MSTGRYICNEPLGHLQLDPGSSLPRVADTESLSACLTALYFRHVTAPEARQFVPAATSLYSPFVIPISTTSSSIWCHSRYLSRHVHYIHDPKPPVSEPRRRRPNGVANNSVYRTSRLVHHSITGGVRDKLQSTHPVPQFPAFLPFSPNYSQYFTFPSPPGTNNNPDPLEPAQRLHRLES